MKKHSWLIRLKTLVIEKAWLLEGLEVLLPAFPVLDKLYLVDFQWNDSDHTVSSASLRQLTIDALGFEDDVTQKSISFDTASLIYLKYDDFLAEDYPKVSMTKLVKAVLNLVVTKDQLKLIRASNEEDVGFLRLRNVWKLFSGIRNVRKAFFNSNVLEVLSLCCESMPVFNNLKLLRISSLEERGWQAMSVLLRNCPHLETLVLKDKCGDACDCIPREDKGRSLRSCPVKKLKIKRFGGTMRRGSNSTTSFILVMFGSLCVADVDACTVIMTLYSLYMSLLLVT